MAEFAEKVTTWWESRTPQEQRTLKIAVPIILLMLLYILLIEPILSLYSARKDDYQDAQNTLTWLYDQTALVSRIQNNCGARVYYLESGDTPDSLAQSIARRSSINADFQREGESVSVSVASAPGNRLLAYVQAMACNGYHIERLDVERLDAAADVVKASFQAVPIALPSAAQ